MFFSNLFYFGNSTISLSSSTILSLVTLFLLASSATAAAAQPASAEPTKVTKLHTNTNVMHAPYRSADGDIRARQLAESTWSEPSWVLFNGPTTTATTLPPATTPAHSYPQPKQDNTGKIVFITVLTTAGGSMILYGLLGCCIKAWCQRSRKAKDKAEAPSKRKRNPDVERTAGLVVNAAAPGAEEPSSTQPRSFEECMDEIVLTPKYPEPVYMTDLPPQTCHYPEGEGRQ